MACNTARVALSSRAPPHRLCYRKLSKRNCFRLADNNIMSRNLAFELGMSPVVAPDHCPRCHSSALDATLDWGRHPDLNAWHSFKSSELGSGCGAIVLVVLTLGIWLIVLGLWSLIMLPVRMGQKSKALAAAPQCVRSQCRMCSLIFYPSEMASMDTST